VGALRIVAALHVGAFLVTTLLGAPAELRAALENNVLLFNILHIEDPVALLREAYRALRPDGTAGILHWNHDPATPRGPSLDIRPRPGQCRAWAEQAGFEFVRDEPLTCCAHHYGLVVRRPI